MKLTNHNWKSFAALVASPADPSDYNEAAVKRLMTFLDPYVVDIKGVKPKYKPLNKVEIIEFATDQERETYQKAYDEYLARKAEIEGAGYAGYKFDILVQLIVFQKKAELIRAPEIARRAYNVVNETLPKSAVIGVKYKNTISKIVDILINDYNVSRDNISLIWGGRTEAQRKKNKKGEKKLTPEQKNKLRELFDGDDLDFLKELGIDVAEELLTTKPVVEDKYRLGIQSRVQRQDEIDKFQDDKSHYCIFTYKAGGVGLSLHQIDEMHRVREGIFAPTYSAIELVQALCRAHRITSESVTQQTLLFYADTIEVSVAHRVSQKLKCLRHVVRKREDWSDVILGGQKEEEELERQVGVIATSDDDIFEEDIEGEDNDDTN